MHKMPSDRDLFCLTRHRIHSKGVDKFEFSSTQNVNLSLEGKKNFNKEQKISLVVSFSQVNTFCKIGEFLFFFFCIFIAFYIQYLYFMAWRTTYSDKFSCRIYICNRLTFSDGVEINFIRKGSIQIFSGTIFLR